ncbi:hypothetical protein K450DRAFT_227728 [Umbelopsis ramanniana AG]|uniref:Yeast cell wall synthesis Kre9/Knh1-like N-terminal domain-containing protein n=1 Tax=Umbelopsis ramanniana AG TaxID=1314678 RepID=A0AAD5HFL6_UMBRA|nr:uncharacterized protein K450DRAFT_227728 [Umbelopsis ramanniana AG]KAI8582555.1 hypothetical protein K450DRAFT_227728 [Umbelopsis ramanniana AG]
MKLIVACLTFVPSIWAFSVTFPLAGSTLKEGSSFVVGWILPSSGTADIKLVSGAGEPYTTIATLQSAVSMAKLLQSATIPSTVPPGAYYIQIGDAPNDAIGGPYTVSADPTATNTSAILTASSVMSSIATSSVSLISSAASSSSSIPLSSSTPLSTGVSTSSASQTATSTDLSNADTSPTSQPDNASHGSSNGGIIGGVIGGVAAAIAIPAAIFLWRRNKKRQQQQEMSDAIYWNDHPTHDHDDGPSWGYPSSLKYSNASVTGANAAYDPTHRQDNMTPYSQAGYYEGYSQNATTMYTPPPAITRDAAMAGAYYNNGYPHHNPDEAGKFEENAKTYVDDEPAFTQKPDQK